MKIWFKQWKDNRLVADYVVEDYSNETRTHKVFNALEEACHEMDVARPIWLDSTVRDFKQCAKSRFGMDAFVVDIYFDYLEIEVLEED